jgi:hypothetical protein
MAALIKFNQEKLWPTVLDRIANGESLSSAIKQADGKTPSYSWAKLQLRNNPELKLAYQIAVEDRADRLAEELIDLADTPIPTGLDPASRSAWVQHLRIRIDTRKWAASKLKPKTYGDRIDVSVNHDQISIQGALDAANRRIITIDEE